MDRRQRKTRDAIFTAFMKLLSEKSYNQISVQEIIDAADIGRTTFYAHFETKDYLLKELCEELCGHMIETAHGHFVDDHRNTGNSIFLHLLIHFQENNQNILSLLTSPNNEIFLNYFKNNLNTLILAQYAGTDMLTSSDVPKEYLINHISTTFVGTVYWWIAHKMKETPQEIEQYFKSVLPSYLRYDKAAPAD